MPRSTPIDSQDLCATIGLSWVDPDEPGIVRQPSGRGFTFRWPDGTVVRGSHRERCEMLAIPPAWTDVWVSAEPDGHLQAVGLDEAGRRQYRYHDRWTEARNAEKFDRLAEVGERLSRVRRAVEHDLRHGDREHRTVAAMIRLIDQTLGRIGNAESVERFGTRGISTLGPDNVEVSTTTVQLSFRGKGQSDQHAIVIDRDLAHVIAELEGAGREWLFEVDGPADRRCGGRGTEQHAVRGS